MCKIVVLMTSDKSMNPDTVNEAWRSIVSGANNVLLANIAYRHGTAVLKLARKAGLLDESEARGAGFFMTSVDKHDFSSSFRIHWNKIVVGVGVFTC